MSRVVVSITELRELSLATADYHEASFKSLEGYRLTLDECAELACEQQEIDKSAAPLIASAMQGNWNEMMSWAGDRRHRRAARLPDGFVFPTRAPISKSAG